MKLTACSIIAEYNPFHNGHLYQLSQAKRLSHADVMVAIMSGNWMQRGEPAIVDKWIRTLMALNNGINLVIELPVNFSVQAADIFASGGVQIAEMIQSNYLAFGCEHPDLPFDELAQIQVDDNHHAFQNYDLSYAAQFQQLVQQKTGYQVNLANDVLALGYARAKYDLKSNIQLLPVQRIGSDHIDSKLKSDNINSGSAIRRAIFSSQNVDKYVPNNELINQHLYQLADFWPLIRYQLIESSLDQLKKIYQMNEGIEHRLKKAAITCSKFDEFMTMIKTKRYSYGRLQRLLFYLLIKAENNFKLKQIKNIRILGFDHIGQRYLKQIKKQAGVPIITTPGQKEFQKELPWTVKSGMLLTLQSGKMQDYFQHPIIK